MPKCETICIFRVWTLLVRSPVRDLLLERVWHAFGEILVLIETPIGAAFGHFWQVSQGLILEAVLGRQEEAKTSKSAWGRDR